MKADLVLGVAFTAAGIFEILLHVFLIVPENDLLRILSLVLSSILFVFGVFFSGKWLYERKTE